MIQLSSISKKISQIAHQGDKAKLKGLNKEYQKVENQFEDLLIKIRLQNPRYADFQYPEPITVANLQNNILKKGELLLQYFISGDHVYALLVSMKDFNVIRLKTREKEIQKAINRYLIAMKSPDTRKLITYGQTLYHLIFEPLESFIKGKLDIIIVPHGQLETIPFEPLVIGQKETGEPEYLLEKYRVKYIQSASTLRTLRKFHYKKSKTNRFIGFGDPVYDYEKFKQGNPVKDSPFPGESNIIKKIHRGKYNQEGGHFHRLKASGQEVEAIARLFRRKSRKAVVLLRENRQ